MNQNQLSPKIQVVSQLSSKLRRQLAEHGFSHSEINHRIVIVIQSFLPYEEQQNQKDKKVDQIIEKLLGSGKKEASRRLTCIIAALDMEVSQMKMNEEEEQVRKGKGGRLLKFVEKQQKKHHWSYIPKEVLRENQKQPKINIEKEREYNYNLDESEDSSEEFQRRATTFEKSLKDTLTRTRMLRAYLEYQLKDDVTKSKHSPFSRLRDDFLSSC